MDQTVNDFYMKLIVFCAKQIPILQALHWSLVPSNAQVFRLSAPANLLIYVKNSDKKSSKDGWWGVGFTIFKKLCASTQDWRLVLLVRGGEEGYVLTATQVKGVVSSKTLSSGQYKLHEKPDAEEGLHFETYEEMYRHMLT